MSPTRPAGNTAGTRRGWIVPLVFLTATFFLLFISRIVVAPLMVPIQSEFAISHEVSGRLLLWLAAGICLSLLGSGFVSRALTHKNTIALSAGWAGASMLAALFTENAGAFRLVLFSIGLGVGAYIPSAVATITSLAPSRHWGKALSVHEAAPNLAFVATPLLAEAALALWGWRSAYALTGGMLLVMAAALFVRGPGRGCRGQAPRPALVKALVGRPAFWLLLALFSLAIGAVLAPYNMLPLYLVSEHGYPRSEANLVLMASRLLGVFMGVFAGWLTDRLGALATIILYFLFSAATTAGLGLAHGAWLVGAAIAQQTVSVCFFPAGLTLMSRTFDAKVLSVAVSLVLPLAALVGAGLLPAAIGWCGDHLSFAAGFVMQGAALLAGLGLALGADRAARRADSRARG